MVLFNRIVSSSCGCWTFNVLKTIYRTNGYLFNCFEISFLLRRANQFIKTIVLLKFWFCNMINRFSFWIESHERLHNNLFILLSPSIKLLPTSIKSLSILIHRHFQFRPVQLFSCWLYNSRIERYWIQYLILSQTFLNSFSCAWLESEVACILRCLVKRSFCYFFICYFDWWLFHLFHETQNSGFIASKKSSLSFLI